MESKAVVILFFCPAKIDLGTVGLRFSIPYPKATSSTRYIGPKMSVLYRGIVQIILFPFGFASSLPFRSEDAIIVELRSRPSILFTRSTSSTIFLEFSDGVELFAPEIFTEKRSKSASRSVFDTTASVSSAAFLLMAVTSIRRFFVFSDIVVRVEFIIGGNEIVLPVESKIIGTLVALPSILPYFCPTSVFSMISVTVISEDDARGTNL